MQQRKSWQLALAAVFLAAGLAQAAKAKVAATPEDAVKQMAEAYKAGDVDGILALVAEPSLTLMKGQLKMFQAHEALEAALEKKFGKDKNNRSRPPSIKELLQRTTSIVVFTKKALGKDKVQLTVWETQKRRDGKEQVTEKTWTAVRAGKGWKLLLPSGGSSSSLDVATRKGPDGKEVKVQIVRPIKEEANPKMLEYFNKMMPKYTALVKKFAKEVKAGKYETRKEAQDALKEASEKLRKDNPPPRDPADKEKKDKKDKQSRS